MLGGNNVYYDEVENDIANFFHKESCMIMSSGYLACMSAVQALCDSKTIIIADQYLHACINSGIRLSNGKRCNFKHNDMKAAERLFIKHKGKKIVMIIESLYSMDGDIADLPKARELCTKYNALLIIDEAHGLGTLGKTGRGAVEHYNMSYEDNADVILGTFSKSLASVGGFICASKEIIVYMEFFAQGSMFSAGISVFSAAAAQKSLEILKNNPTIVVNLQEMSTYFRNYLMDDSAEWNENTPETLKYKVGGIDGQPVIPIIFHVCPIRVN